MQINSLQTAALLGINTSKNHSTKGIIPGQEGDIYDAIKANFAEKLGVEFGAEENMDSLAGLEQFVLDNLQGDDVDKVLASIDQLRELIRSGDTANKVNFDPIYGIFADDDSGLGTGNIVNLLY